MSSREGWLIFRRETGDLVAWTGLSSFARSMSDSFEVIPVAR